MQSYSWAKIWIELIDDPKMGRMSDHLWRRTIEFILLAKELNQDGELPSLSDMAWRLHTNPEILEAELTDLANAGIVSNSAGWAVTNFKKRQSRTPAAQRMIEYRNRKRREEVDTETDTESDVTGAVMPVTICNDDVTDKSQEGNGLSEVWDEMRSVWAWQFPQKPKPREDNKTLQGKIKTRLKAAHFKDNWRDALLQAGKSDLLASSGWFDFGWFVKNDDNYEKCLNGNYDNRRSEVTGGGFENEIMGHIKKWGSRKQPSFNGQTEKVMRLAGGYRKLCQMNKYEAVQAIRNASKGVSA